MFKCKVLVVGQDSISSKIVKALLKTADISAMIRQLEMVPNIEVPSFIEAPLRMNERFSPKRVRNDANLKKGKSIQRRCLKRGGASAKIGVY